MTVVLFALAAGLILFGGINGVQAAPRSQSASLGMEVELSSIDTSITRDGVALSGDQALDGILAEGEKFKIGKTYDDPLCVTNNGDINEYVRVTVTRYWTDKDGNEIPVTSLDPSLIELTFGSGWNIDEAATTAERTVLYYPSLLVVGDTTSPFVEDVKISNDVSKVIGKGGEYEYEGVSFHVKAVADAVQEHNGPEAMTGAWGRTNAE